MITIKTVENLIKSLNKYPNDLEVYHLTQGMK